MGLGKTSRHLTLQSRQTFNVSLLVMLRQTLAELGAPMPVTSVLRTFVQYLIAFCSQPDTASDIIFGMFVGPIVDDMPVKLRDSRLNRS